MKFIYCDVFFFAPLTQINVAMTLVNFVFEIKVQLSHVVLADNVAQKFGARGKVGLLDDQQWNAQFIQATVQFAGCLFHQISTT